jgi:TetR/AcrR family transcriptional regulator
LKKLVQEDLSVQDRIIHSAVRLFAMKGYAGVSVRELAKEAGVNIALISYYFGGKEKLYSHILSTQFEIIESTVAKIEEQKILPMDKIITFQKHMIALHQNYPYLIRLAISEIINPTICYDNIVKLGITKLNHFLRQCVTEGIESGSFRHDIDPAVVAISFISLINFLFLAWPLSENLLPDKSSKVEYYIDQAFDNHLKGILNVIDKQ